MRKIAFFFCVFLTICPALGEVPTDPGLLKLLDVIRQQVPDAKIETTADSITAKSGTMMFTLHGRSKTGEVSPQTYQEEGPNFKGFVLKVTLTPGRYEGAAMVPQTLRDPYYPKFIDARPTADGASYYWVNFAYGSRFDKKVHNALHAALPGESSLPASTQPAR